MDKKDELRKLLEEIKAEDATTEQEDGSSKDDNDSKVEASIDAMAEKLANKIADAVIAAKGGNSDDKQYIKEKIYTPEKGLQIAKYPALDEIKNLSKDEVIVTFFKAVVNARRDDDAAKVLKALTETDDTTGGYLVPSPLATEVYRIMPDVAVMRKIASVVPMTSQTLDLSTLTARPYAYWTGEYVSKTTTSAEFGRVTLSVNDLVCLLPVTHQLLNDANINMVSFITQLFAEAIAREEDKAFFTGSGTGRPKGISTETIASRSAGASIDFDDILDLLDLVPQAVRNAPKAAFVANKQAIKLLRKVKDTDGDYIWRMGGNGARSGQIERLPDTLYEYPIYEQNDLSEDELYFGDWSQYIIGDRQQIVVETTTEGGDAWRRNAMEIKAVERVDGKTVLTNAFAKLTNV